MRRRRDVSLKGPLSSYALNCSKKALEKTPLSVTGTMGSLGAGGGRDCSDSMTHFDTT